ncbi:thioredoxin Clot [Olea europaea subsp. europaea]|uniref:Thioredoxin Clot n=1 Tax=Olea europaea subsp. europaea TaxID=158383 RepID=A0A8S0U740_OLEEU|nr:thioredoxin Clot [Olea europaea subsp. europaea]
MFGFLYSDCVRAEPIIYKKIESSPDNVALLKAYVGDKFTWRNPLHPWRIDSRNQNHSRSQNRNLNANSNPNLEEDFNLRETLPALGGGRVSNNEQADTAFDLVKEMDYLYVMVVKAKEFFAKGWEWQPEPL